MRFSLFFSGNGRFVHPLNRLVGWWGVLVSFEEVRDERNGKKREWFLMGWWLLMRWACDSGFCVRCWGWTWSWAEDGCGEGGRFFLLLLSRLTVVLGEGFGRLVLDVMVM